MTTAMFLGHLADGCILNPCSPGVQINPPPITSGAGMGLAALVFVVFFLIGAGGGKKGKK